MVDQDQSNKKEDLNETEGIKKEEKLDLKDFMEQSNKEKENKENQEKPKLGRDKSIKEKELGQSEKGLENQEGEIIKKESFLELAKEKISKHSSEETSSDGDKKDKNIGEQARMINEIKDADTQVERLVKLAIEKDPFMAIKIADHLDQNYVLDKLHDELLKDKIQTILKEKGILK